MRQHQGRVRRMRRPGRKPGPARSADGARRTYHCPDPLPAVAVAARQEEQEGLPS